MYAYIIYYNNARGCLVSWSIVHIGVGLCVARSVGMGNARASVLRTGNSEVSTLFVYAPYHISNPISMEALMTAPYATSGA